MSPLFEGRPEAVSPRLRLAAAWLSDTAGLEHPDYRGEHAFFKPLRMPVVALDHTGRAFLALALSPPYEAPIHPQCPQPTTGRLRTMHVLAWPVSRRPIVHPHPFPRRR